MKKPVVAILMATYNGAKFIRKQIGSILNQQDVDVCFYISDDGSTDETLSIHRSTSLQVKVLHMELETEEDQC